MLRSLTETLANIQLYVSRHHSTRALTLACAAQKAKSMTLEEKGRSQGTVQGTHTEMERGTLIRAAGRATVFRVTVGGTAARGRVTRAAPQK